MPMLDRIEAGIRVMAVSPSTRILLLTAYDSSEYVTRALHGRITGYLLEAGGHDHVEFKHSARRRDSGRLGLHPRQVSLLATNPSAMDTASQRLSVWTSTYRASLSAGLGRRFEDSTAWKLSLHPSPGERTGSPCSSKIVTHPEEFRNADHRTRERQKEWRVTSE